MGGVISNMKAKCSVCKVNDSYRYIGSSGCSRCKDCERKRKAELRMNKAERIVHDVSIMAKYASVSFKQPTT